MADVNPHDMIEEIQANIQTGDLVKAKLVLAHIRDVDQKTRNKLMFFLTRADADFSIPLFLYLLKHHADVVEEMPIIRDTLISILIAYPEKLIDFLASPKITDKFELIRVAGELRLEEATPALLDLITSSEDDAEINLIIESLGLIGDPDAINTLTDYLYAANRELIIAAIHALGQVGTPTAMHRLAERMGTDNEIDYLILSIFSEVQDQVSLEKLNDTIRSHYAHMRTYAKAEIVRIGAKAVPILIENLLHDDPDFLIHTLNVLSEIGDESAVIPIRKLLSNEPRSANVRFAAYEALALLPLKKGAYTLTAGLTDSEDHVCIAAARAIDRNFSPILGAGIKNLLRGPEKEARHIAKIIVNGQVDNVFINLVEDEVFEALALEYLPHTHRDIRDHYHKLLVQAGKIDFAKKLTGDVDIGIKPKVVAIDDSRMILNIYKATLHELGYDPVLFEFPASALEWLKTEKPLMVLTDLNMPEITGIQLAERVREKYTAKLLPIIMVTTQNESQDNEAAMAAGVNAILNKPFNVKTLGAAMEKVLTKG
ncbi:MAG: HEAT repeat domain-containing protein [Pseudomonadota bacterium]